MAGTPRARRAGIEQLDAEHRGVTNRCTVDAWPHIAESATISERGTRHVERRRHRPLPVLLTVDEAADLLRTTRRAIYAMIERRQLPGVIRVRRRVLLRADDLLDWLNQKRGPSPEE